jgi:3-oxoacyl-[acyl-carrier protein] reductase
LTVDHPIAGRIPAQFNLAGRNALITGAGSEDGIGFATARALAELGATVIVTATTDRIIDRANMLRADGYDAHPLVADLTDPDQVDTLVSQAKRWCERIDIVVNNAGMTSVGVPGSSESGSLMDVTPQAWRASLARNLDTAYLVSRAALPDMREAGWGRVVMVTSVTGPVMSMRGEVAYATAKSGLVGLTRALAVDHAADGITVNAIAPGWIATGSQTPDEQEQGARTPMGRSGTPGEVASAIAWLVSPGAGYITGQCITVDGGNSIAEERA